MNLLALVPQKIAVLVVGAVACVAVGFGLGAKYVYGKWLEDKANTAAEAVKIVTKQGEITERVVTKYATRVVQGKTVTNTIKEKVTEYVESKPLALSCVLDNRWVRLHDAAALGAVPPAASLTDGNPGAFTAASALPTVTANYGACGRNADRLEALQEWVREQAK